LCIDTKKGSKERKKARKKPRSVYRLKRKNMSGVTALKSTLLIVLCATCSIFSERTLPRAGQSQSPQSFSEQRAIELARTIEKFGSRAVGTDSEQLAFEFVKRRALGLRGSIVGKMMKRGEM
jgi:hypothetical protein